MLLIVLSGDRTIQVIAREPMLFHAENGHMPLTHYRDMGSILMEKILTTLLWNAYDLQVSE